jgi:hypothetical protein
MSTRAQRLRLSPAAKRLLMRWVQSGLTPQRVALRARIVLLCAEGISEREVARRVEVHRHTVALWRARFLESGAEGLVRDKPGRGRKPAPESWSS